MIRKFRLTNGAGDGWDLNSRASFFHSIAGLGFKDGTQYEQVGTDFIPLEELFSQGEMSGRILFGGAAAYQTYRNFSRFVRAVPLTLIYQTDEVYRVPVRLTELSKGELMEGGGGLVCDVAFLATGLFYKSVTRQSGVLSIGGKVYPYTYTYSYAEVSQNTLVIESDSYEDSPCKVTIHGLSVAHTSTTADWSLHITPAESGGHYNIVNLMDSVIVPAMQKYGILVKAALDIQNREIHMTVGRASDSILTIEADLPNIIKKSVTIKQVSADVNKLVLYDNADYAATRTYYLHPDLGYDTYDRDRITPVVCELQAVQHEEGSSFDAAAIRTAHDKFSGLAYSNLIELTMANDDGLVKPERMEFGQEVDIISDGVAYRSILTGRERGKNTKLVFGTVRLDLTKILRRGGNG